MKQTLIQNKKTTEFIIIHINEVNIDSKDKIKKLITIGRKISIQNIENNIFNDHSYKLTKTL